MFVPDFVSGIEIELYYQSNVAPMKHSFMKFFTAAAAGILFITCFALNNNAVGRSYDDKNPVIAHRGAWKKNNLPENSIASLQQAIKLRCAGSEFDVRMTADDSLVINHDPSFNGLIIERTTYAQLEQYKLFNGEKLPTFSEYISAGIRNNRDTKLICEIKPSEISKERSMQIAEKIVNTIHESGIQPMLVYISFDIDILKRVLQTDPQAITQYLESDRSPEQLKLDGITGADYHISVYQEHPDWIDAARKNHITLNAWTVNEATDMNWLLTKGLDYITTNEPELLFQQVKRLKFLSNSVGKEILKNKKGKIFDQSKLSVKWRLKTNVPKTISVLTIKNNGKEIFPASGWDIYFNSNRDIDSVISVSGISIKHINGDIYKLSPDKDFKALNPKDSIDISYRSRDQLRNYTAAPSGFYIVWAELPEKGFTLSDYALVPITDTSVRGMTPQKIYDKNASVKSIPGNELPKIFPTPVFYKETQGEFVLDANTLIITDTEFRQEAAYLSGEIKILTDRRIQILTGKVSGRNIFLKKAVMPAEAYLLSVTPMKIEITAGSSSGIFYGIQSLRSLISPAYCSKIHPFVRIASVEVNDAPRFGYRSLMLDVARNFQNKKQVMKILDLMALYKLNTLHFHLTDDEGWRIEIPSLPELTSIGANRGHTTDSKNLLPASYGSGPEPGKTSGSGYYTKTDFIEILRYATERHIQVIPEIESPGHGRAAIKAMDARYEYFLLQGNREEAERYLLRDINDRSVYSSAQNWSDNVICVALPSTYRFIEKVVDEFRDMYKEANAPLSTVHLGGDEVPWGVWDRSQVCQELIKADSLLRSTDDLWYYYYSKVDKLLNDRGLILSGWEEIGLRKTRLDKEIKMIPNPDFVDKNFHVHVWNNMIGWGSEDLPYRLANAGYKVILSCVSNNYLDLAYFKSPEEPGYYWGGYQDIDKPFYFIPFDYYKTTKEDAAGNPADPSSFSGKDRLTDFGKSNILGIQGLLWSENLRSVEQEEYLLLPKLLGIAERAWAKDPAWATERDKTKALQLYDTAWSEFVNIVGRRELPRLDYLSGGFQYRIPTVGLKITEGAVVANIQLPGMTIRFTTDGADPTLKSEIYTSAVTRKGEIRFRAFNSRGRGGRTVSITNN